MNGGGEFLMYPPLGPPGHIPGVHVPGTLTPIAAVIAMQQQAAAEQAEAQAQAQAQAQATARLSRKRRSHVVHHRR